MSCTPIWLLSEPIGTHRERHHVHRAAVHTAGEQLFERFLHLFGLAPVVGRTGFLLGGRADEGAVFDAGDVAGVGETEVGVGALGVGEPLEGAGVDEQLAEAVVLLGGAVTPVDGLGLGERGDLLDPRQQTLVVGVGGGGGGGLHDVRVAPCGVAVGERLAALPRRMALGNGKTPSGAFTTAYRTPEHVAPELALAALRAFRRPTPMDCTCS